jgi:hypothetical protein
MLAGTEEQPTRRESDEYTPAPCTGEVWKCWTSSSVGYVIARVCKAAGSQTMCNFNSSSGAALSRRGKNDSRASASASWAEFTGCCCKKRKGLRLQECLSVVRERGGGRSERGMPAAYGVWRPAEREKMSVLYNTALVAWDKNNTCLPPLLFFSLDSQVHSPICQQPTCALLLFGWYTLRERLPKPHGKGSTNSNNLPLFCAPPSLPLSLLS